jgi:sulfopyruvate decarboxylase subunit beta
MMDRKACLKAIARHVDDADIVLPVYSTAFDWIDIRPSPLNYLSHGAMGLASSHALGLALGRPDKRVIVLDGDGSLLMNIGTLVSAAEAAPKNLIHFVCENGTYEANGGHPIPGRGKVSFAGLARSAGYKSVHEFSDLKIFEQQVGAILAEEGPVFIDLKVEPAGPQERDYSRIHGPQVRQAFKDALKAQ